MPIIYHTSHTDNHTLNNSWHTYLFESEVKLVRILYVSNLQAALLSNVCIKLKLVQEFLSYIFFLLEVLKTRGFQNMLFSHWPTENLLREAFQKIKLRKFGHMSKLGLPYLPSSLVWTKISPLIVYPTYLTLKFGHFRYKVSS